MVDIQRPSGVNVGVRNPGDIVYIKGDAFTDGSIRFISSAVGQEATLEVRRSGIFRSAGLNLAAASLALGLDLTIAAQGSQLKIESLEAETTDLSLGTEFNDFGSGPPKTPILGARINRIVVQADTSEEEVTTSDTDVFTGLTNAFRYTFYFKTGSVAATTPVTLQISKGSTPGGQIIFSEETPASDWPTNTEVVITLDGGLDISPGKDFSSTLFSDEDFSLLGNFTSGAGRFFAFDIQPFIFELLVSSPQGTDRFLSDNNGDLLVDNAGNLILDGDQVVPGTVSVNALPLTPVQI